MPIGLSAYFTNDGRGFSCSSGSGTTNNPFGPLAASMSVSI